MKKILEIIQMLEENENAIPITLLIIFIISWHQGVQSYLKGIKEKEKKEDEK